MIYPSWFNPRKRGDWQKLLRQRGVRQELNIKLRILSLGAGVQSTTLALMASSGIVTPMPDCAIFADTGWESSATYEHLDWLETVLNFPILRVKRSGLDLGSLAIAIAEGSATRSAMPPWYVKDPNGMLPQQCSKEFKTRVVIKEIRRILHIEPGRRGPNYPIVEQWLGISSDEVSRIKLPEPPLLMLANYMKYLLVYGTKHLLNIEPVQNVSILEKTSEKIC